MLTRACVSVVGANSSPELMSEPLQIPNGLLNLVEVSKAKGKEEEEAS